MHTTGRAGCRRWGLLAEFGLVFAQSPEVLSRAFPEALEGASIELPGLARLAVQRARLQRVEIECHLAWCDERIAAHVRSDEQAKKAMKICGIGPVTASALVAAVGDFKQFETGAQLGAWLGLVPSQNSRGGQSKLGKITKRGDEFLRTLLIQGAKSAVMTVHKRGDQISQWLTQLLTRVGWQKAVVALANKNARILWAVLAKGGRFDADHVSHKPEGPAVAVPAMAR